MSTETEEYKAICEQYDNAPFYIYIIIIVCIVYLKTSYLSPTYPKHILDGRKQQEGSYACHPD